MDPEVKKITAKATYFRNKHKIKLYRAKNKEKIKAQRKKWYWANREEHLARARVWQAKNKDKLLEYKRKQNRRHPERVRASQKKYYEKVMADPVKKAKLNETQRKYYQKNKEKILAQQKKYRSPRKPKSCKKNSPVL